MGHPLTPDLSKMSMEDVTNKLNDLYKRLSTAHRAGSTGMVGQLHLLIEDYQGEVDRRNRAMLEEMEKNSKQFKNIIDIK